MSFGDVNDNDAAWLTAEDEVAIVCRTVLFNNDNILNALLYDVTTAVVGVFCPKAGSFLLTPSFSVMCLFFQLCVINHTLFIFLHQCIQ